MPTLPQDKKSAPWHVDSVHVADGQVVVTGWALPLYHSVPQEDFFLLNSRPFNEVRYPLPRPDVGKIFWQRSGAELSGFQCRAHDVGTPYPDGILEIQRVNPGSSELERGRDSWYCPDPSLHRNLPDPDQCYRVIANRDPVGFLTTGATDYHRLDSAAIAVSGKHLHEHRRVLDWGCGCGRLARHFPGSSRTFHGCDIDHDNVQWCASHLTGTFTPSRLVPPLPFQEASFDLIYGLSVFTHLRELLQLQWLEELARVTSTRALLLLTIHGPTALEFAGLSEGGFRRLSAKILHAGIFETGSNTQIDGHAEHDGEYVDVFHDHNYIHKTWGRFFDVVAIVPGYIFTHDLVILRKN